MLASLNVSRNSIKEKVLLYSNFYIENHMWLTKRCARKSIFHGCMVWIEKSVTRDHCSESLGKPRDADRQIFLSTRYTHERYLFDVVVLFHLLAIADKIYGNNFAPWSVEILIKYAFP